jgi:hypothetical protein
VGGRQVLPVALNTPANRIFFSSTALIWRNSLFRIILAPVAENRFFSPQEIIPKMGSQKRTRYSNGGSGAD